MARNKNPEITINRILDTAHKLFMEKSYEQTTIQDIVDDLGDLSKGAVYHHFKSKEEIIDAVMMRIFQANNLLEKVKDDKSLNGLQKIKKIFIESISSRDQQQLYRFAPTLMKNPKFLSKQLNQAISVYAPLLQEYIEEGISDGSIAVDHPKELSQVIMLLVNIWLNPGVFDVDREEFNSKLEFLKKMFEDIGLPVIDDKIMTLFQDFQEITSS